MNKILDFFNKITGLLVFLIFLVLLVGHIHHGHFRHGGRPGHYPNASNPGDSARKEADSSEKK